MRQEEHGSRSKQLDQAVNRCPSGPTRSRVNVSGVLRGKRLSETDTAIYQVHGPVLSGLYAYGGSVKARERAALRAVPREPHRVGAHRGLLGWASVRECPLSASHVRSIRGS